MLAPNLHFSLSSSIMWATLVAEKLGYLSDTLSGHSFWVIFAQEIMGVQGISDAKARPAGCEHDRADHVFPVPPHFTHYPALSKQKQKRIKHRPDSLQRTFCPAFLLVSPGSHYTLQLPVGGKINFIHNNITEFINIY